MAHHPAAHGTEMGQTVQGILWVWMGFQVTLRRDAGVWAPAQLGQSKWRHQENL